MWGSPLDFRQARIMCFHTGQTVLNSFEIELGIHLSLLSRPFFLMRNVSSAVGRIDGMAL